MVNSDHKFFEGDRMAMKKERQSDIAHKILVARICESGIPGKRRLNKELAEVSKVIGVDRGELHALYVELLPDIISQIFGLKNVKITHSSS